MYTADLKEKGSVMETKMAGRWMQSRLVLRTNESKFKFVLAFGTPTFNWRLVRNDTYVEQAKGDWFTLALVQYI